MKLNLFLLLCVTGLVPVTMSFLRTVPRKYELIESMVTWEVAQNYCRVIYEDLATILSDTDLLRLDNEAQSKHFTGVAWIGMYNAVHSWRWYSNDLLLENVTYINWYSGHPEITGWKTCGGMDKNGFWLDKHCETALPFVCYNANFTGESKFIGVSQTMTWHKAQAYCRWHHTDLATALNETDNEYIKTLSSSQGPSWIDLYRDLWVWSDGSNASQQNSTKLLWDSNQPDDYYGNENCVQFATGVLNDVQCTEELPFFCHTKSPKRSQTVRLTVESKRRVFDPEVQSSILEQLKKKLEENGTLVNLTLSWKVQPDGNIFHKKKKDEL